MRSILVTSVLLVSQFSFANLARPEMVPTLDRPVPPAKMFRVEINSPVYGSQEVIISEGFPLDPSQPFPGQPISLPKLEVGLYQPWNPGHGETPLSDENRPPLKVAMAGGGDDIPLIPMEPPQPIGPIENPADVPQLQAKDYRPADEWNPEIPRMWVSLANEVVKHGISVHTSIATDDNGVLPLEHTIDIVNFSKVLASSNDEDVIILIEDNPEYAQALQLAGAAIEQV